VTCVSRFHQWLFQNGLFENLDKLDAIVFQTGKRLATLPEIASVSVVDIDVTLSVVRSKLLA
jgi:hypothetical protein